MKKKNPSDELDALRVTLAQATAEISRLSAEVRLAHLDSDVTRSSMDVDPELLHAFWQYRTSEEYGRIYVGDPLVSVCITTHNRADLLVERCLPSVLSQDYPNFEVVVVGDGCTDSTEARMAALHDPRVRFANRPPTRDLPIDPIARWSVAGADAANHTLELAKGPLLTHLDDDDEYLQGRLSKLVRHLQETRAELTFHPFLSQPPSGPWGVNRADSFQHGKVTTGAVLELAWFKRIAWNPMAYVYKEPGDWNRFRRIQYLGARIERHPEVLLKHYGESKPTGLDPQVAPRMEDLNAAGIVTEGFAVAPYSIDGLWPDGWVGQQFAFTVVSPEPSAYVELLVEIPSELENGLQLDIVNGDSLATVDLPRASMEAFKLPLLVGANEPVRVEIRSRSTWCPAGAMGGPDLRRLAFRLVSLNLCKANALSSVVTKEREAKVSSAEQVNRPAEGKGRKVLPHQPWQGSFEVDFANRGNSHQFTGRGWSFAEPDGTWTDGRIAELVLPAPSAPVPEMIRLQVGATPVLAPAQRYQSVNVELNGSTIAQWKLYGPCIAEAAFPASLIGGSHRFDLELHISNPISPMKLGLADDNRQLGLLVSKLTLARQ